MRRRFVELVHSVPGRTRLRLRWLRDSPEEAAALADRLSALPGVEAVEVRPFTGSVLCTYAPEELSAERLQAEALRFSGPGAQLVHPGERLPYDEAELAAVVQHGSAVACAATRAVKEINLEVLRASEGRVDLGILASLFFLGAGAAEVVASRRLPLPPWFNLGWWAFRTFLIADERVIEQTHVSLEGEEGAASPQPPPGG